MNKVKSWILGIIIAVVFVMFCAYGTNLLYKSPEYNQYCRVTPYPYYENITKPICEAGNGTWVQQNIECVKAPCIQGYCDYYSKCQTEFDKADKNYSQNLFIISLIFSLIVIGIAMFFIKVESVAGGLMLGSLFFIIYGTARYWRFMENWGRFIILGLALAGLIYIGYRTAKK